MATYVTKVCVYDKNQSNLKVGCVNNPPADENFDIPISITTGLYELYCYAIAWLSSGFYSKASSAVKMIINAMSKYPLLANYNPVRLTSENSYDAELSYNVTATFDVANDFNFIISTQKGDGSWVDETQLPTKSDNNFAYTKTIDTTETDFYHIKAKMIDKNLLEGNESPVKTIIKGDIPIGSTDGVDIIIQYTSGADDIILSY